VMSSSITTRTGCHATSPSWCGRNLLLANGQEDFLTVVSKWGADGEYIHGADKTPWIFSGKPAEYWTDRRKP